MKLLKIFSCFCLIACLSVACTQKQNYIFQQNKDINDMQWKYTDKIAFDFTIEDTTKNYLLGICMRYTNNFPDANLYLFVRTTFPNQMQSCDTISIDLFYPDGSPTGKGKRIKELNIVAANLVFPQQGTYTISLQQGNRYDTLPGVISAGIFISEDTKNNNHETNIKKEQK